MFPRNSKPTPLVEEYNSLRSKKVKFLNEKNDPFSSTALSEPDKNFSKKPEVLLKKTLKNHRKPSNSREKEKETTPTSNAATLKDLCPEDKAKIGELIKKLAEEKGEKEQLLIKLEEKQTIFENSMKEIRRENEQVALESLELKEKFKQSINLLKNLQKNNEQNKENIQNQRKIEENRSPFKENIKKIRESEKNHIFETRSPSQEKILSQVSSPKREFLRISSGETERRLMELASNRSKTSDFSLACQAKNKDFQSNFNRENNKNEIKRTLEDNSKNLDEIGKLKDEIDSLAMNLKKLQLSTPQKNVETTKNQKKPEKKEEIHEEKQTNKPSLYFQNLQNLVKNKEKSPEIMIIEDNTNKNNSEDESEEEEEEIDETMEIARKWLDSKRKKQEKSRAKNRFTDQEIEFSQEKLSSLRCYLDKKLEDFDEEKPKFTESFQKKSGKSEAFHNNDDIIEQHNQKSTKKLQIFQEKSSPKKFGEKTFKITDRNHLKLSEFDQNPPGRNKHEEILTPEPQKLPIQLKEPSFLENNSEFLSENASNKKNDKKREIFEVIKESLQQEVRNEISNSLKSLNLNEVLSEKLKEFLFIKDRVLGDEKPSIDEKSFKKKERNSFSGKVENEENITNKEEMMMTRQFQSSHSSKKPLKTEHKHEQTIKNSNNNPQIDSKRIMDGALKHDSIAATTKPINRTTTFGSCRSDTQPVEEDNEDVSQILNNHEDFYENGLFDLIDELDQREFERSQQKNLMEFDYKRRTENRNIEEMESRHMRTESSCLGEIIEESREMIDRSYTETDASIREIKKEIREMERRKKK